MRFTLCMRYRKYLRWDLRSACIIVKIYAPKSVIFFTQIFSFMDPYSINSFFVQCFFTSLVFYGMNVSAWRRQVCKFQIIRLYIHRSADKILESTSRCEQTQVREGVQKTKDFGLNSRPHPPTLWIYNSESGKLGRTFYGKIICLHCSFWSRLYFH